MSCFVFFKGKVYSNEDFISQHPEYSKNLPSLEDGNWNEFLKSKLIETTQKSVLDNVTALSKEMLGKNQLEDAQAPTPLEKEYKRLYTFTAMFASKEVADRLFHSIQSQQYVVDTFQEIVNNKGRVAVDDELYFSLNVVYRALNAFSKLAPEHITGLKDRYAPKKNEVGQEIVEITKNQELEIADAIRLSFIKKILKQAVISPDLLNSLNNGKQSNDILAVMGEAYKEVIEKLKENGQEIIANTLRNSKDAFKLQHALFKKSLGSIINVQVLDDIDNAFENLNEENLGKQVEGYINDNEVENSSRFSKVIKLIVASIQSKNNSPTLNLSVAVNSKKVIAKIYSELAGLPVDTDLFFERLLNSQDADVKAVGELFKDAESDRNTSLADLKHQFTKSFSVYNYNYFVGLFKNEGLILETSNRGTAVLTKKNDLENLIIAKLQGIKPEILISKFQSDYKGFASFLFELPDIAEYPSVHGDFKGIYDALKSAANKETELAKKVDAVVKAFSKQPTRVKKIAEAIVTKEVEVEEDVSVVYNVDGKRIFPFSRHSAITMIASNMNYYGSLTTLAEIDNELNKLVTIGKITHDQILETKEDISKKKRLMLMARLPYLFTEFTENSFWKSQVLNKNKMHIRVLNGIKDIQNGVSKSMADATPQDFLLMSITAELHGVHMSLKHADRSLIYAIEFENKENARPVRWINDIPSIKSDFIKALSNYNKAELNSVANDVLYFEPRQTTNKTPLSKYNNITDFGKILDEKVKTLRTKLLELKLLERKNGIEKIIGVHSNFLNVSGAVGFGSSVSGGFSSVDNLLYYVAASSTINYLEEVRMFHGSPNLYKNDNQFFQRAGSASSTGNPMITGISIQDSVDKFKTELEKLSGMSYEKQHKEKIKEVVTQDVVRPIAFLEGIRKAILAKTKDAVEAERVVNQYKEVAIDDAASQINIFEAAEYYQRAGKMTESLRTTFKFEAEVLKILNNRIIDDKYAEVEKLYDKYFEQFVAQEITKFGKDLTEEFKVKLEAEIRSKPAKLFNSYMTPLTVLKPQYHGHIGLTSNTLNQKAHIIGARKTSYLILSPSLMLYTSGVNPDNGQIESPVFTMNNFLIRNGIGVKHNESTAKFGVKAKNGKASSLPQYYNDQGEYVLEQFYTEGEHNSYLDYMMMKDQVDISAEEKNKVLISTQEQRNILANMNENPDNMDNVNRYIELVEKTFSNAITEFSKAENFDYRNDRVNNLTEIKKVIKQNLTELQASEAMMNALEVFSESNSIDLLANRTIFINQIMSVFRKNLIRLKRNGNMDIQHPYLGFESSVAPTLKHYIKDDEGTVGPAEVVRTIPQSWVPQLLKFANTNNVFTAVGKLNDELKNPNSRFHKMAKFRSLRMPHQELSSSEVFQTVRYIPPVFSNLVLVADGITTKSGSDFDVDKLVSYFLNIGWDLQPITVEKAYKGYTAKMLRGYNKDLNALKEERDALLRDYNSVSDFLEANPDSDELLYTLEQAIINSGDPRIDKDEALESYFHYSEEDTKNIEVKIEELVKNRPDILSLEDYRNSELVPQSVIDNERLYVESDLLLNNIHMLLSPVDDSYLKKEVLNEVQTILKTSYKPHVRKAADVILEVSNFDIWKATDITTQAEKKVEMTESTQGVAIVAVATPAVGTHQLHNMEFNSQMNDKVYNEEKDGENETGVTDQLKSVNTYIPFEKAPNTSNYSAYDLKDLKNIYISRLFSYLLSSQVDAQKNPYATALNIKKSTLGIINHLVYRGFGMTNILLFMNQPIILEYLTLKTAASSAALQRTGTKIDAEKEVKTSYNDVENVKVLPSNQVFKKGDLTEGITKGKYQKQLLDLFITLEKIQEKSIGFNSGFTPDRTAISDLSGITAIQSIQELTSDLYTPESMNRYTKGKFYNKIFQAQRMMASVYQFTNINKENLPNLFQFKKEVASYNTRIRELERFDRKVDSEFILYIIQNFSSEYKKYLGYIMDKGAIAKVLREYSNPQSNLYRNPLLSEFIIQNKEGVPSMRLHETSPDTLTQDKYNYYVNQLKEVNLSLDDNTSFNVYELLVFNAFRQTGQGYNMYNYMSIFDNKGLEKDVLKIIQMMPKSELQKININDFIVKFFQHNVAYAPTKKALEKNVLSSDSLVKKLNIYRKSVNFVTTLVKDNKTLPLIGKEYHKDYGIGGTVSNVTKTEVLIDNMKGFDKVDNKTLKDGDIVYDKQRTRFIFRGFREKGQVGEGSPRLERTDNSNEIAIPGKNIELFKIKDNSTKPCI